ncbi:hypothetical protein LIER_20208 [Lithospermum erythrorhizon]|uniref:Uncharacterized protein n=1 Tax=Lithospermum erythrorhizon TaxID=34254 RepID=A0AAV3QP68_LITER
MEGDLADIVVHNVLGKGGNVDERVKGGNERKASLSPSKVEAAWGDEKCDHEVNGIKDSILFSEFNQPVVVTDNLYAFLDRLQDGEGKENKLGRNKNKVRCEHFDSVYSSCLKDWRCVHNTVVGKVGRIWICWNPKNVDLCMRNMGQQHIMVEVSQLNNGDQCIMSAIYGDNLRVERQKLWRNIEKCCAIVGGRPWLLTGDFNCVLSMNEAMGGGSSDLLVVQEFRDCVEKVKLEDVAGKGCNFTWFRGATMSKLDRVTVNREWCSKYSRSYVVFEAPELSDHTPMSIMVEEVQVQFGSTFKFHEFWYKHAEYMELLKRVWAVEVDGNEMVVIRKKLTEVKKALKEFNLKHFNKFSHQVKEKEFEVEMVQKSILSGNGSDGDYYKEKKIREEFYILKSVEESYFRAKARVSWTMLGDDCTKFFHAKMRSH